MLVLTARGPKAEDTWRRRLPKGEKFHLGRKPEHGWAVEWDRQISREHVEIVVGANHLEIRRVEGTTNRVLHQGRESAKFTLLAGQEFQIGQTTFKLSHVDAPDELVLGSFRIVRPLASSDRGSVRLAQDETKRTVVLKVLDDARGTNPEFVARFLRQGNRLTRILNGNLVMVHEAGQRDGQLFVSMEHIAGTDLRRSLASKGPRSLKQSVEMIRAATRALQCLHENGMAHLNLKPSNMLIHTVGTIKLTDVGQALPLEEMVALTTGDQGTADPFVDYLAPEQAANFEAGDIRSDIYSLGCLWYEMLTGSPPFPEAGRAVKLRAHAIKSPPDPRKKVEMTAEALTTLYRMLAKSPADRFQTPAELLKVFEKTTVVGMSVTCTHCHKVYRIDPKSSGKILKCKECGAPIRVPTIL